MAWQCSCLVLGSGNGIGDEGGVALAKAMGKNGTLTSVDISGVSHYCAISWSPHISFYRFPIVDCPALIACKEYFGCVVPPHVALGLISISSITNAIAPYLRPNRWR